MMDFPENVSVAFNFGMIEIVLFYGLALGWAAFEYVKTDRLLKKSKSEEAAQNDGSQAARDGQEGLKASSSDAGHTERQEGLDDRATQARPHE